jgi:hypothetical protein
MHQVVLESIQDESLERLPANALAARAAALVPSGSAGEIVRTDGSESAAAYPTSDKAGKQMLWASPFPEARSPYFLRRRRLFDGR